jgi:hypothetical protein
MKKTKSKLFLCTQCGGDATIAWENKTKKDIDCFGGKIKPKERLCLACGKKMGVNFTFTRKGI